MIRFDNTLNISGTSSNGVEVTLNPDLLSEVFPNYLGGGDKTTREWYFEFEGETFTLYDWKETSEYQSGLPAYSQFWSRDKVTLHLGSRSSYSQEVKFRDELLSNLASTKVST